MLFKQLKVTRFRQLQQTTKFLSSHLRRTYIYQCAPSPFIGSRRFSTSTPDHADSSHLIATQLKSRSLIRLYGPDTWQFLQGLITNHINHLDAIPSIYSLILNHQGRVLYDVILYNAKQALPSNDN